MNQYLEQSQIEHRFWLQILGDHSRFIFLNLAPTEVELMGAAKEFIVLFDDLLEKSRASLDMAGWSNLAQEALSATQSLRLFKLEILKRHLFKQVQISLSPAFFNHMLNELEEYLRNLGYLTQGQILPAKSPVHHHLLWVMDAIGHADSIYCLLDSSQTLLRLTAETYKELWSKKYLEAVTLAGFLRTGQAMFPALGMFNTDTAGEMIKFKNYLHLLKTSVVEAKALGTMSVLIPDHMDREECYYLFQLYRSDPKNVLKPDCDPTKPRAEA